MQEIITLEFQDNETLDCEILGVFPCLGKEYIALVPSNGTDDVYIYEYYPVDGGFKLQDIEDEETFNTVLEAFVDLISS